MREKNIKLMNMWIGLLLSGKHSKNDADDGNN